MTRKEYNKRKAQLEATLKDTKDKLSDVAYCESLPGDGWNDLHDLQYDTEEELKHLEFAWDTRNWTASDWNSWDLITSNID
jgi:hypothetical protein